MDIHYLDWGGRGPALVFIPGMGNTAHVFDDFAPRFTDRFRVIGVTRVGFGESDQPEGGAYAVARRVEHIRAVLDALGLAHAALVGHSLGGDELTAFARTYRERTVALVYLDAAYDHTQAEQVQRVMMPYLVGRPQLTVADLAGASAMQQYLWCVQGVRLPLGEVLATLRLDATGKVLGPRTPPRVRNAVMAASVPPDYTGIGMPVLALYSDAATAADILTWLRADPVANEEATAALQAQIWPAQAAERARFGREIPGAEVASFAAHHYNFLSHPGEVELRMRAFLRAPATDADRLARDPGTVAPKAPLRQPAPRLAAVPLPAEVREAAAGTFELELPRGRVLELSLRAEGNDLLVQLTGQGAYPLVYLGDHTFGAAFDSTLRLRVVLEEGRATKVVLQQAGGTVEGRRQP